MASGGSREPKKYHRKAAELEWDVYDDDIQKAKTSWKNVPQLWSTRTVMQYVSFLTLIGCGQDLVTSDIANPNVRVISSSKTWRQNGDF